MIIATASLLHILVLVYWLGGDLGVFYASTLVSNPKTSPDGRKTAAQILAQVDMAPRTAMILTLPTGLTLADAMGYVALADLYVLLAWVFALFWLALAWYVHLKHLAPSSFWRRADLGVRFLMIIGLLGFAVSGTLPLFIAIKLVILASTIILGLLIRRALAPFGPAFAAMIKDGPTPESDTLIAKSLNQSRPLVVGIWMLLLIAALTGIMKPTF